METKNNSLSVTGNIVVVLNKKQAGQYSIQEFVIQTKEEYPQLVKFEVFENRLQILDGLSVGQEVEVLFSLRGREYNGNYYNNIRAWKINPKKSDTKKSAVSVKPADKKPAPVVVSQTKPVEQKSVEQLPQQPTTEEEPVF